MGSNVDMGLCFEPRRRSRRAAGPVLGGLAWITAAGCQTGPLPPAVKEQMAKAERQYRAHEYVGANQTIDGVIRQYPQHAEMAPAYYLRSLCYSRESRQDLAGQDAQMCLKLSQDADQSAKCHITLAEVMFERGDTVGALSHYEQAMPHLVEAPPADLVHYHYGICLQKAGRWSESRGQFEAVVQRYLGSSVADWARQMLEWRGTHFSIQCGAFREESKAKESADRLKRAGLAARVEMKMRLKDRLYMVYVGQYPDQSKAESALPSVRRIVKDALVVP